MGAEMQKELLARLDVLAAKLGVAAEHLWAVAVRQQFIDGVLYLFALLYVVAFSAWALRRLSQTEEWYDPALPKSVVQGILVAFSGVVSMILLSRAGTKLLNPEYAALREILGALR